VPFTDLPPAVLREYRPELEEPVDFDAFWQRTLAEQPPARIVGLEPADTVVTELAVDDLVVSGYAGDPVRAWVTRPRSGGPHPVVVEFIGYNGGRGLPGENLRWAAAGFLHVLMDTRGQGGGWGSGGATGDPHGTTSGSSAGWMTRGVLDPHEYYYRRVFTDAVRLIEVAGSLPDADGDRIAVTGNSQGGGISLAAAALAPHVRAVLPDVPFLCCFRRAVELSPTSPYDEIARYLSVHRDHVEPVFRTLGYFDGVSFARRVRVPALVSVGLMDDIVLPSTVYAAYNHLASVDRELAEYPFNGHEGGAGHHFVRQVRWLRSRLR